MVQKSTKPGIRAERWDITEDRRQLTIGPKSTALSIEKELPSSPSGGIRE
jgi:hypothetical protein